MYTELFQDFLAAEDSLRVYEKDNLRFVSQKEGLLPLLDYIQGFASSYRQVTIFDKIVGNAAALLSIKAGCREVYSPLGSDLAIQTLNRYGIRYHLDKVVPYILRPGIKELCPMEKLSMGKSPGEFYQALKSSLVPQTQSDSC